MTTRLHRPSAAHLFFFALAATLGGAGCPAVSEPTDAGRAGDAGPACARDADCDDGVACTGPERCAPADPAADARGCVRGASPCAALQICDEAADACVTDCGATRDADRDGARSVACGGDDCDDGDPTRRPGALEVCDAEGVDEDCDPATFGERDADRDGAPDAACCNGTRCGSDCDDAVPTVHPGEAERCDGTDQDCDGAVDEGIGGTYHVDADGDGHGSPLGETRMGCTAPDGFALAADDCDDAAASVHPGAYDACDAAMADEDCSGTANDPPGGCACADGESRSCPLPGACAASSQACVAGTWGACGIAPVAEICANDLDEDCDGAADDGCACDEPFRVCGTDVGECVRGAQRCSAAGEWGACVGEVAAVPETCNGLDDDCDGTTDEGLTVTCYRDGDADGFAWASAVPTARCGTTCTGGWTARAPVDAPRQDCDDTDPRAFPGQTAYATSPRTTAGGYDFDCDGTVVAEQGVGCVTAPAGGCVADRTWSASTADCGRLVRVTYCWYESAATGCDAVADCSPSPGSSCGQRVGCR